MMAVCLGMWRKGGLTVGSLLINGFGTIYLAMDDRMFGLDPQTLFDTCITLLAMLTLFIFLSYMLFNPARNMLKKRQELISSDMEKAAKEREEAEAFKAEYDAKLKGVQTEAEDILSQTRKKAQKKESEIIEEAKSEANRIMKRAEKEIDLEKDKAKDQVKKEMVGLASLMAGKLISVSLDEGKQSELIEDTLKEMGEGTWQN